MSLFPAVICWELALGPASYESFQEDKGEKGRGNITLVKGRFLLAVQADCAAQISVRHHDFGDVENLCVMTRFYIIQAKL